LRRLKTERAGISNNEWLEPVSGAEYGKLG
jgi:hypothetical protein